LDLPYHQEHIQGRNLETSNFHHKQFFFLFWYKTS